MHVYLLIYLVKYLFTYLPIYLFMEKIEVQMLLYTLTKNFIEIQGNMLNVHLVSYCFTKWCSGLMAKTLVWNQKNQSSIPLTNTYYVKYVYSYI
jgi:hypothetical protein